MGQKETKRGIEREKSNKQTEKGRVRKDKERRLDDLAAEVNRAMEKRKRGKQSKTNGRGKEYVKQKE